MIPFILFLYAIATLEASCKSTETFTKPFKTPTNASYFDSSQHPVNTILFKDLPCPKAEDIAPCKCEYHADSGMDMICFNISGSDQLYDIFHSAIPFPQFSLLELDTKYIDKLSKDVFGEATFERVYAMFGDGILKFVDPNTFMKSSSTLKHLDLSYNELEHFPFNTLLHYTNLDRLAMNGNPISGFQIFESQSLTYLDFGDTLIDTIPIGALDHLPNLMVLGLQNTQISDFPIIESQMLTDLWLNASHFDTIPEGALNGIPNLVNFWAEYTNLDTMASGLFTSLDKIQMIHLCCGQLEHLKNLGDNNAFILRIDLSSNQITTLDEDTFTGIHTFIINMRYNQLSILPEATWKPVIDAGTLVKLEGNNLSCGCDVAWLVLEPRYHELVADARCQSGELLVELDPGLFENCNRSI